MKLLICSDLHLEFPQQMKLETLPVVPADDEFDLVIGAGDIGYAEVAVKRLASIFPNHRVLFVPGNHEYYKDSYGRVVRAYEEMSNDHVTILNPGRVDIGGRRIIRATMWSDLQLKNHEVLSDQAVERAIADFSVIHGFTAADMRAIHRRELEFVESELQKQSNDNTVVITHFVPSQDCVHPRWAGLVLNPYFTNDHDFLMDTYKYPLHVFGHTHDRFDQDHDSGTRLIGNPRGYPNENSTPYEWKIVEV